MRTGYMRNLDQVRHLRKTEPISPGWMDVLRSAIVNALSWHLDQQYFHHVVTNGRPQYRKSAFQPGSPFYSSNQSHTVMSSATTNRKRTASMTSRGLSIAAWTLASLVAATTAAAQTLAAPQAKSQFMLGVGAVHAPEYEGSDRNNTRALPLINYRSGRLFVGTLAGIGYDVSSVPDLEFGPVLSYRFGRKESDSVRLRGLGDIDAGADLGGFVRWNLKPYFLHATLKYGLGGDARGTQLRLGAGYGLELGPADRVVFDAGMDWADRDVMQGTYGVSALQSARSGLPQFNASSGLRRYGVGAVWTHTFTSQWFSTAGVALYRLGGDAANSPITVQRNVGLVSVGLGYRF